MYPFQHLINVKILLMRSFTLFFFSFFLNEALKILPLHHILTRTSHISNAQEPLWPTATVLALLGQQV